MSFKDYKKILVFQTAFLGDALLAIPLIKALKYSFPTSQIGFVCRQGVGDIFQKSGVVDLVIEVDKTKKESLKEAFSKTKEFKADLIVSPHRSFRTALWVFRLRPRMAVGFQDLWSIFSYHKRVKRPLQKHDVLRQLSLLESIGIETNNLPARVLDLTLPGIPLFKERIEKAIYIAPGSQWPTKKWTENGFAKVASHFLKNEYKVRFIGNSSERDLCERIAKDLPGCENLAGQTSLSKLTELFQKGAILLSNDSGAMHVASIVQLPVVSIFGPTVPAQGYAPWNPYFSIVENKTLPCRPCGAHGHLKCPLGTHECMKSITEYQVIQAITKLGEEYDARRI